MARKAAKGTAQVAAQLDQELLASVRAFAVDRGETLREVFEMALRRHIANPPPKPAPPPIIPLPPFPPVAGGEPVAKPAAKRKGKGK